MVNDKSFSDSRLFSDINISQLRQCSDAFEIWFNLSLLLTANLLLNLSVKEF